MFIDLFTVVRFYVYSFISNISIHLSRDLVLKVISYPTPMVSTCSPE